MAVGDTFTVYYAIFWRDEINVTSAVARETEERIVLDRDLGFGRRLLRKGEHLARTPQEAINDLREAVQGHLKRAEGMVEMRKEELAMIDDWKEES